MFFYNRSESFDLSLDFGGGVALKLSVVGEKREGGSEPRNVLLSTPSGREVNLKLDGCMSAMDGESTHLAKIFCI